MIRILLILLVIVFLWALIHSTFTILAGLNAQPRASDVAVVLGTRVERSGAPSWRLRERLDRAYELYQDKTVKNIIVSGGLGREGHEEADAMREYLMRRGVPFVNIFVDRNGDDTFESARHAHEIMNTQNFHSAVIVSHYYHLPRAALAFKRFGIPDVSAAAVNVPPQWRDTWNILREFAAFYFYLVRAYATT